MTWSQLAVGGNLFLFPLRTNNPNLETLTASFGSDENDWVDKKVTWSVDEDEFDGRHNIRVEPLRITLSVLGATLIIAALVSLQIARSESTISCPTGTYDMLDWMTMDSDLRSTYHMEGTLPTRYTPSWSRAS